MILDQFAERCETKNSTIHIFACPLSSIYAIEMSEDNTQPTVVVATPTREAKDAATTGTDDADENGIDPGATLKSSDEEDDIDSELEELNELAEKEWKAFITGVQKDPPSFRTYVKCNAVHKKWILSSKCKGRYHKGKVHRLLLAVQKIYYKKSSFKLGDYSTLETAKQGLIQFVENAAQIIQTQDALREEAKIVDEAREELTKQLPMNKNERARIICIIADPEIKLEIDYVFNVTAPRRVIDRKAPSFESIIAPKFSAPHYKAPLPAAVLSADTYSVLKAINPNEDIDFKRPPEYLARHYRNMRTKYSECLKNFEKSGNGNTEFWDFAKSDPIMLLIHNLNAASEGALDLMTRFLPSHLASDSSGSLTTISPDSSSSSSEERFRPKRKRLRKQVETGKPKSENTSLLALADSLGGSEGKTLMHEMHKAITRNAQSSDKLNAALAKQSKLESDIKAKRAEMEMKREAKKAELEMARARFALLKDKISCFVQAKLPIPQVLLDKLTAEATGSSNL